MIKLTCALCKKEYEHDFPPDVIQILKIAPRIYICEICTSESILKHQNQTKTECKDIGVCNYCMGKVCHHMSWTSVQCSWKEDPYIYCSVACQFSQLLTELAGYQQEVLPELDPSWQPVLKNLNNEIMRIQIEQRAKDNE